MTFFYEKNIKEILVIELNNNYLVKKIISSENEILPKRNKISERSSA